MMVTLHSYWAYFVLIVLIVAVANAVKGLASKNDFSNKDLRLGLFTLIFSHIQLLLGLAVYFSSTAYKTMKLIGIGNIMKNKQLRLLAVEHPIVMILAITLITMGWSIHKKKNTSAEKFKTFVIFYGIALILVLSRIPWNNWF